jgi:hypothetical protein
MGLTEAFQFTVAGALGNISSDGLPFGLNWVPPAAEMT